MKILVIANSSLILWKFRKELLEKLSENYNEIYVICPKGEYTENLKFIGCKCLNIDISRRGTSMLEDIKLMLEYRKIVKKISPKIILTYTIKPNIYGGFVSRLQGIKLIPTITGLGTGFYRENLLSKFIIFLYKNALKNSKYVFFQNEDNKQFFLEKQIVEEKQIKIVKGSGVNLENFKYEILLKSKKIKFLFIGRIMNEKGIEEYLEVAKRISKKYSNVEFEILGQFEEESYKKIIKKYQENKFVKYLGTSKDVREQIKKVHCLINPSWHEGMSNVLLEAGAMKRFLIASEIPGCKEIVLNEQTGFTFEKKNIDELEKKVDDFINLPEKKYKEYIDKSYEHIKNNFSRKIVVDEYLKVINDI